LRDGNTGAVSTVASNHVGLSLFAVIVCRKFAALAALSWHLPHHKNAAAMNRWVVALARQIFGAQAGVPMM
jgi:hypothetical protein